MDDTVKIKKRVRKTKAVRRREIAEAAVKIMAKHGYHGTSVERIAKAVGISNSALYQHFRNREDVLYAATELLGTRAHEWMLASQGETSYERLENIAAAHLSWSASSLESFVRPFFAIVGAAHPARNIPNNPASVRTAYDLILPIVERGQREGSIRADADPADVVWAILMFAWAEDMALLARVDEVIEGGSSRRNFVRLLSTYAPPGSAGARPAEAPAAE